jgi:molybdopterin-guanine dinucleotide biosynthesis protein A
MTAAYDAVVLAGGAARRMGGTDKLALPVAGRQLLDHVLAATTGAQGVVVVGPSRPAARDVVWCREEPAGGGPAAALAAALPHLTSEIVVLVAGDLPLLTPATVDGLAAALAADPSVDGAVGVDDTGRIQWLMGAWRAQALATLPLAAGASLRDTLGSLRRREIPVPSRVSLDIDTPDDVARAEQLIREPS